MSKNGLSGFMRIPMSQSPDKSNISFPSFGDSSLLSLSGATAFLSSRRGSARAALACLEWAEKRRTELRPVIGGFHSDLERDVLKILLRGRCPVVLVLARTLWKRVPDGLRGPIGEGRLLVVAPVPVSARRVSAATALLRNRFVLEHCAEIVLARLIREAGWRSSCRTFPASPFAYSMNSRRKTVPGDES